jgi:hypothetical protein
VRRRFALARSHISLLNAYFAILHITAPFPAPSFAFVFPLVFAVITRACGGSGGDGFGSKEKQNNDATANTTTTTTASTTSAAALLDPSVVAAAVSVLAVGGASALVTFLCASLMCYS